MTAPADIKALDPETYISEADVAARWPMLSEKELRKARRKQLIDFYNFKIGPCYTAEQVQSYIDRTYLRGASCAAPSQQVSSQEPPQRFPPQMNPLKSEASTSTDHTPSEADSSMPAGMTPALALSAVELLAQRIGKRPRSNSLPSSSKRPPPAAATSPVLVKS